MSGYGMDQAGMGGAPGWSEGGMGGSRGQPNDPVMDLPHEIEDFAKVHVKETPAGGALGLLTGCSAQKAAESPNEKNEPVTVAIPMGEPVKKTKPKEPSVPTPEPICFRHVIGSGSLYFLALEKDFTPLGGREKPFGWTRQFFTDPDKRLEARFRFEDRIPLRRRHPFMDAFIQVDMDLYPGGKTKDDKFLYFSLRAYQCFRDQCFVGDEKRLLGDHIHVPVEYLVDPNNFDPKQFWHHTYYGTDVSNDEYNHIGVVFGYEQVRMGAILFIQDPNACLTDEEIMEEFEDEL